MIKKTLLAALLLLGTGYSPSTQKAGPTQILSVAGLEQPVEIIKDKWGISHIYAQSEHDLFFSQGYNAARDRLFQLEVWRRQASGTTAEILGTRQVARDHGTRLFRFRGNLQQEMNHYHPRGEQIITAFVEGVNAYIDQALKAPDSLPLSFQLLGIKPGRWSPEIVISRHQGLLGNIEEELDIGRSVCLLGEEKVKELEYFHPHEPRLDLDATVDCASLLENDILGLYRAYRRPLDFAPEDILNPENRSSPEDFRKQAAAGLDFPALKKRERDHLGSNNWVVSGKLTQDGHPIMANDPHRLQAVPSLRYWVHLSGPGWNVIGGGEPEIPGVSIGHNEHGAWGLTVFRTDGEDLYVYRTNPENPNQYRHQDGWEEMRVVKETIPVKNSDSVQVELKYTRHGPVVFEDRKRNLAYAVRPAWMEVGGAPYLASLRMDQAADWNEFREACSYSNIPGENMVWADRNGNIGWQAVGIAPIRRNFSGIVPVAGDGSYEWDGFLPIKAKPHGFNPPEGFFATANSNLTPPDFPFLEAIGYTWTDPFRWARLHEFLSQGRKLSRMDMIRLQHDYLSVPARTILPLLEHLQSPQQMVEQARKMLLDWDFVLHKDSAKAGLYVVFERRLLDNIQILKVSEPARRFVRVGMKRLIDFLIAPDTDFGDDPVAGRDAFLMRALEQGVSDLREKLGNEMSRWNYGQTAYKHVRIEHPLSPAVNVQLQSVLNVGPVPRGGNSYTVNNTGSSDNQRTGASFRILVDTRDWDASLGMNSPGQAGDPSSPFYKDLFPLWADDGMFPVYFSRQKIDSVASETVRLQPAG